MATITRRFKPARSFGATDRILHEIRCYSDGSAVYWVQPVAGDEGKGHSEIRFDHAPAEDFERAVAAGELLEVSL